MAKNLTIAGANYNAVPGLEVPVQGGGTAYFPDVSATTATDADVTSGKIYFKADGTQSTGTGTGGGSVIIEDTTDVHGGTIREITATNVYNLRSASATPSETAQTITPGTGYQGLSQVEVGAISSTYIGSDITQRTSADLAVSGATVTAPAGYYASAASTAVASGTAGTPSASKSAVNNHSVTVTPSVTNTTGYITGGTKTGTAVSVTAAELASGDKSITANGTNIDVVGYSTVSVNVSGGGKNAQIASGCGRAASSSYSDVGLTITVAKAGTYHVYWSGYRSSTSGTSGSQLYKNDVAQGSVQTTFNSSYANVQNVHLTNISLAVDDVLTVRARSRGNNYYMYIMNLTIIEA